MHTLVYKRVKLLPSDGGRARTRRNSDASVSIILFASVSAFPAVLWWDESLYLLASALGYVIVYLTIYRRLVRFGARAAKRPRKVGIMASRRMVAVHRAEASRRTIREAGKSR
jgi:hypothetical protein